MNDQYLSDRMNKQVPSTKSRKAGVIGQMLRNAAPAVAVAMGLAAFPGVAARAETMDCCAVSSSMSVPAGDMDVSITATNNPVQNLLTLSISNMSTMPGNYRIFGMDFDSSAVGLALQSASAGYSGAILVDSPSGSPFGKTYEYGLYLGPFASGIPKEQSATFTLSYTGGNGNITAPLSIGFADSNADVVYGEYGQSVEYGQGISPLRVVLPEPATFLLIGSAVVFSALMIRKSGKGKA